MDMFRIHGIAAEPAAASLRARTFGWGSTRRYGRRAVEPGGAGTAGSSAPLPARPELASTGQVDQYFEEYFFE